MAGNYTSPLNKRIVGQRKARISRLTSNQTFCDDKHLGERQKKKMGRGGNLGHPNVTFCYFFPSL